MHGVPIDAFLRTCIVGEWPNGTKTLEKHPAQFGSYEPLTRMISIGSTSRTYKVSALSAAVFVEPI